MMDTNLFFVYYFTELSVPKNDFSSSDQRVKGTVKAVCWTIQIKQTEHKWNATF